LHKRTHLQYFSCCVIITPQQQKATISGENKKELSRKFAYVKIERLLKLTTLSVHNIVLYQHPYLFLQKQRRYGFFVTLLDNKNQK
jgi:hypothetical protein